MKQLHLIKKQLIEFEVDKNRNVSGLQEEISTIYHEKIIPYIETCCNALSPSDAVHKIEALHFDLGEVDRHLLATEFEEKLKPLIHKQLSEKIKTIPHTFSRVQPQAKEKSGNPVTGKTGTDLEMFVYFIQTGLLPWWAKKHDKHTLQKKAEELMDTAPDAVKTLFTASVKNNGYLKRIIFHFTDRQLLKVVALLAPQHHTLIKNYWDDLEQLTQTGTFKNISPGKLRSEQWRSVLLSITHNKFTVNQKEKLIEKHLQYLASGLKTDYAVMIADIKKHILKLQKNDHAFKSRLPQLIIGSKTFLLKTKKGAQNQHAIQQLARLQKQLDSLQKQKPALVAEQQIHRIQQKIQHLQKKLEQLNPITPKPVSLRKGTYLKRAISRFTEMLLPKVAVLKTVEHQQTAQQLTRLQEQLDSLQKKVRQNESQKVSEAEQQLLEMPYTTFNQSDELYITNAGLILLWPFITRFFQTVGLVKDNVFLDKTSTETSNNEDPDANRARGVLLLHYLTGGPTEASEHLLPLNKILCGIPVLQPLDTSIILTEQEKEESESLLTAVISNNPLWKNLTTEGFQNAYLQREGILSLRDGNWWLQVEKKTYDITLNKLSWATTVVKLPWMEHIVYTEWN